jgi:MerR family transcriptional regulator, mercuric resistance operon regulatory protein
LLELPEKPYGGSRSYDEQDLQRLRFIRRAQQLGFSLDDIRELLELSSSDCERVEELAAQKLTEVKAKLRQLRRIEWILAKTVEQCGRRKSNQPCPIINIASIYQVFIKQAIRPQGEQRPSKALVLGSSPSQPISFARVSWERTQKSSPESFRGWFVVRVPVNPVSIFLAAFPRQVSLRAALQATATTQKAARRVR